MTKIHCHLICHSNSVHLSQIYTCFSLLHEQGLIELTQTCVKENYIDNTKPQYLRNSKHAHLLVIINNLIKIYYDTHDSYEFDTTMAICADYYFKRSYLSPETYVNYSASIKPLGLNYQLYSSQQDPFEIERASFFETPCVSNKLENIHKGTEFWPTVQNMTASSDLGFNPSVLFMTRTWEPDDVPDRPSYEQN